MLNDLKILFYGDCILLVDKLPAAERKRLAGLDTLGIAAGGTYSQIGGSVLFGIAMGNISIPDWAGPELLDAIERAKALLMECETAEAIGKDVE